MFYRYINTNTNEILCNSDIRPIYKALIRDRREALENGYTCSASCIEAVKGDYRTESPYAPRDHVVRAFPAFSAIQGTLYESADLSVRGFNILYRNGYRTNAALVELVRMSNTGAFDFRRLRNAGRRTISEYKQVAKYLVSQPIK